MVFSELRRCALSIKIDCGINHDSSGLTCMKVCSSMNFGMFSSPH